MPLNEIRSEFWTYHRRLRHFTVYGLWRLLMTCPGGVRGSLIRGLIAQGELEGRPFDVSSIAEYIGIPRTTVNGIVKDLADAGLVSKCVEGRRVVLRLTREGWKLAAEWWDGADPLFDDLILGSNGPDLTGRKNHSAFG